LWFRSATRDGVWTSPRSFAHACVFLFAIKAPPPPPPRTPPPHAPLSRLVSKHTSSAPPSLMRATLLFVKNRQGFVGQRQPTSDRGNSPAGRLAVRAPATNTLQQYLLPPPCNFRAWGLPFVLIRQGHRGRGGEGGSQRLITALAVEWAGSTRQRVGRAS